MTVRQSENTSMHRLQVIKNRSHDYCDLSSWDVLYERELSIDGCVSDNNLLVDST